MDRPTNVISDFKPKDTGLDPEKASSGLCIAAYQYLCPGHKILLNSLGNHFRLIYPSPDARDNETQGMIVFGQDYVQGILVTLPEIVKELNTYASRLDAQEPIEFPRLQMLTDMQKNAPRFPVHNLNRFAL